MGVGEDAWGMGGKEENRGGLELLAGKAVAVNRSSLPSTKAVHRECVEGGGGLAG